MEILKNIKKFGLQHCDLSTVIWNLSILLRAMTLNIDPRYKQKVPIYFYLLAFTISFCYFYVYVFSVGSFVIKASGDVVSTCIIFSLGSGSLISTWKFIFMIIYQGSLRNMVGCFLEFDSHIIPGTRFETNLKKIQRVVKRRAMFFWIVIMTDGLAYSFKPLFSTERQLMEDIEFIYGLSPALVSPNYELCYFLTLGANIFTIYLTATITGFMIIITGYIEAHMITLAYELKHIWTDGEELYDNQIKLVSKTDVFEQNKHKILNKYVKIQLVDIIKKHTTNLGLLKQINNIFRNSIAIEFVLLIISLISELLGGIENTYVLMPFELMQVSMDCFTGQRLIDSSIAFEESVYDSKWENFDATNMKTVMIMLINSQRNMTLSAGGFTTLSYLCLMAVARMIYSTATTLRSTMA